MKREENSLALRHYRLFGAGFDLASHTRGCAAAPQALRDAGLVQRMRRLTRFGIQISDGGDVSTPEITPPISSQQQDRLPLVTFGQVLGNQLHNALIDGFMPVVLGGDHAISIASVSAAKQFLIERHGSEARLGLIWIDAHPDLETPETSGSGNIHGMAAAHLIGLGHSELCGLLASAPVIQPEHLIYIGLRDTSLIERERIRQYGITTYTMSDVMRHGIAAVCEQAIAKLRQQTDGIAVSFDMDVCDPQEAPGVQAPERGGLRFSEARVVMEYMATIEQLMMLDLVEVNPLLDVNNVTVRTAIALLEAAVGYTIV